MKQEHEDSPTPGGNTQVKRGLGKLGMATSKQAKCMGTIEDANNRDGMENDKTAMATSPTPLSHVALDDITVSLLIACAC